MFHDLMKRTNANANVDNIVAELKEDSYRETSPQKQEPSEDSFDIDLLIDFVPIAVYDPKRHGEDYVCPVCQQKV